MDRKAPLGRFRRCLARVMGFGIALLLLLPGSSNAFPVFCMDIIKAPDRVITGCRTEAEDSPARVDAPDSVPREADEDLSPVDALLTPKPVNKQLFQVGRHGLASDAQNQGDKATPDGGGVKSDRISAEDKAIAAGKLMDTVTYDERWYYMSIDKDGTYLFVGDVFDAEDPITDSGGDDYLPDGVGIGKKWTF